MKSYINNLLFDNLLKIIKISINNISLKTFYKKILKYLNKKT